jgi:hypothetical protein
MIFLLILGIVASMFGAWTIADANEHGNTPRMVIGAFVLAGGIVLCAMVGTLLGVEAGLR